MSFRGKLFVVAIFVLVLFPAGVVWSFSNWYWLAHHPTATAAEVNQAFVIQLAPATGTSAVRHHLREIEEESEVAPREFDAVEWGWRETRYRVGACFLVYLVAGFGAHWFIFRVMQGREEL